MTAAVESAFLRASGREMNENGSRMMISPIGIT